MLDKDLEERVRKAVAAGLDEIEARARAMVIQSLRQSQRADPQQERPGLLRTLVRPFERVGRTIGGAGYELGRAATIPFQGREKAYSTQNPFLSEQSLQKIQQDPFKEAFKTTAGLASYAMPFGKGANIATRALIPGAAAAGMFEVSDPEATPGSIATSAAFGATTAGILDWIAPKLSRLLKKSGKGVQRGVLKPKVKPGVKFTAEEKAIQEAANKLGLKGSAQNQGEQLYSLYSQYSDDLGRATKESTKTFDGSSILDRFTKAIQRKLDINKGISRTNYNFWGGKIDDVMNAQQLSNLNFELQGEIGRVWSKLAKGTPLTKAERVAYELWKVVNSSLKTDKAIAPILSSMSDLHKIAPGLYTSSKRAGVSVLGGPKVGGEAIQGGVDLIGRLLGGAGQVAGVGGRPGVQKGSAIGGSALLDVLQRGSQGVQQQQFPSGQGQLPGTQRGGFPQQAGFTQQRQPVQSQLQQILTPELIARAYIELPKEQASKLASAYAAFSGGEKSAAVQGRGMILQQAAPVLERITEAALGAPTGIAGSFLSTVGKIPGVAGGEAEFLRRDTESFARLIASAFASEVGVATDRDVTRWLNMMPRPGDTMGERKRMMEKLLEQVSIEAMTLGIPVPDAVIRASQQLYQ